MSQPSVKIFPTIYEQQIKFYAKKVPEDDIYAYLVGILKNFPDIIVNFNFVNEIMPSLSTSKGEKAIIVSHKSNVFQTIFIIYRVVNFGDNTMIAIYKTSNYQPPKKRFYPKQHQGCFGSKTVYEQKFEGTWPNNLSLRDIFNGVFINTRYVDSFNLSLGPGEIEEKINQQECFNSKEVIIKKQILTTETPINNTMTRRELYHAFFYHCEEVAWKSVQSFVMNY
jgi:predicted ATP-grasp superfamily ATP-dependent carboligase